MIYLGTAPSKLDPVAPPASIYSGFNLLQLRDIPYQDLLKGGIPESIVLSVLCDFGNSPPNQAMEAILQHLENSFRNPQEAEKYFYQMVGLGKLRVDNFNTITSIPYKIDDPFVSIWDFWFWKKRARAIYLMHQEEGLSQNVIARILELPLQTDQELLSEHKAT